MAKHAWKWLPVKMTWSKNLVAKWSNSFVLFRYYSFAINSSSAANFSKDTKEYCFANSTNCESWSYGNVTEPDLTLVRDFDLICDKNTLQQLINTLYVAGKMKDGSKIQ